MVFFGASLQILSKFFEETTYDFLGSFVHTFPAFSPFRSIMHIIDHPPLPNEDAF